MPALVDGRVWEGKEERTVAEDADKEVAEREHLGRHVVLLDQDLVGERGRRGEQVPDHQAAADLR